MENYNLLKTMQTILYVGINNGKHAYKDAALLTLLAIVEDELFRLDQQIAEGGDEYEKFR